MTNSKSKFGCKFGCLLAIAIAVAFGLVLYKGFATIKVQVNGQPWNMMPPSATDVCVLYTHSLTLYEYTIKPDDFFREAEKRGWQLVPISEDESPSSHLSKGVEIARFRYDKYTKGQKLTSDLGYKERVTRGYYVEKRRSLLVYDIDVQRVYFKGGR